MESTGKRVLVFGGSGTAGQAAVRALLEAGHAVTSVLRSRANLPSQARQVIADVTGPLQIDGGFDVVVSCLASRSGAPKDAWAIDHAAQLNVLNLARDQGVSQFILLSAICVQKPQLPFQHAKLAFEQALITSGMAYTILRPTAFFKSLSGQLDRVRAGKPFLVFGDGRATACKPISDEDLGRFIAGCVGHPERCNRILPIGGPGEAITPMDQAYILSELLGRRVKVRHVPPALLVVIEQALRALGWLVPKAAQKAELARIGRYYATESMLVLNPETGRYDAQATPSTGSQTLADHYARCLREGSAPALGEHAVF